MKRLLFVIAILFSSFSFSQDKDAQLWTGVGIDLPINKDWQVNFESQLRMNNNMLNLGQAYQEVSVRYNFVRGLYAGVMYRYSRKNRNDYYFNENRLSLFLRYKYKFDNGLDLAFKGRFQHSFDRLSVVNDILPQHKSILRFSARLKYKNKKFKKVLPFVGTEIFYALAPQNPTAFIDTYRIKAGVLIDLPKRFEIKALYMYEFENRSSDNLNHVWCVQVNYSFKKLIKKKKKKDDNNASD